MGDFTQSIDESILLGARHNVLQEYPLHFAMSQVWAAEDDDELDALVELTDCLKASGLVTLQNCFNETPLHRLASCGLSASARRMGIGDFLASMDGEICCNRYLDHMGRTVLWHATLRGQLDEVRLLLRGRFSAVNFGDAHGISPLHVACRLGYTEVVQTLLNAGAWANCVTMDLGLTPAHYAALYNHVGCLKALIEYGADVKQTTNSEEFCCKPIHFANTNSYSDIRKVLVEAGSDENDLNCTHYVVNRHRATEAAKDQAEVQTLFEVIYASSPAGLALHCQFLKATRKPLPRIPDETGDDPSPVSNEDEDEDGDELFIPPRKKTPQCLQLV